MGTLADLSDLEIISAAVFVCDSKYDVLSVSANSLQRSRIEAKLFYWEA